MNSRHLTLERLESRHLLALADTDRVVFAGDSITKQGALWDYGYVRQFEQHVDAEVIGAGVGWDTADKVNQRLDAILALAPTHVVFYVGVNDVTLRTPAASFDSSMRQLAMRTLAAGATPILCTLSVVGENIVPLYPYNARLDAFSAIVRQVAADTGSQLIDLRTAFVSYLAANNPSRANKGILTSDTIHLSRAGDSFLAQVMLAELADVSVNDAPVLQIGGAAIYTPGSRPVQLAPLATVADFDAPTFDGGRLVVSMENANAADQLRIVSTGGITGTNRQAFFKGVQIGTVQGGFTTGLPLEISLNANCTPAALQALVRAIGFRSEATTPSTVPRTVTMTLDDGELATTRQTAVNIGDVALLMVSAEIGVKRRS